MNKKDEFVRLRLSEERARLAVNQEVVSIACSVSTKTVGRWEQGAAIPSDKLLDLAKIGFDIVYILTGNRTISAHIGTGIKDYNSLTNADKKGMVGEPSQPTFTEKVNRLGLAAKRIDLATAQVENTDKLDSTMTSKILHLVYHYNMDADHIKVILELMVHQAAYGKP